MPKTKAPAGSGKKPPRIHDRFFKEVFQDTDCVISLIRAGAPKALFNLVDWSTLKLEPPSIQVSGLMERFADLVLSVQLRDCEREARIVLLFEHKSYRDRALVRQLATNQFLMYLQDEFKSLIVPIVVTQAPSSKRTSAEFIDLFPDVPKHCWPVLSEFSVNFRCLLINVNELDDKGLAKGSRIDAVIRAMATVRNFDKKDLPGMLKRLLHVPAPDRKRMFMLVLGYVCDYNEHITREDILNLETETPEEQQMVSAVEAFREEGRVEGREEGRVEGREEGRQEVAVNMLQKGMGPGEIVELTDLSRDQVETLQQKMNGASGD